MLLDVGARAADPRINPDPFIWGQNQRSSLSSKVTLAEAENKKKTDLNKEL